MSKTSDHWNSAPTLSGGHVVLEPLGELHAEALRGALAGDALSLLWYTNVPKSSDVSSYLAAILAAQQAGQAQAFAVKNIQGELVGCTRYYDLDRAVPKLSIGYTWYMLKVQRTRVNSGSQVTVAHARI